MIHFSSQVVSNSSFFYTADEKINSVYFQSARDKLFVTMQLGDKKQMTGAEERAYLDFCSWVEQLKESTYGLNCTKNPIFFYANMNTGRSICFVSWYGYEEFGCSNNAG